MALIPVKHPDGGTMLVPEDCAVTVTRTLPSGRRVSEGVLARDLATWLARRTGGSDWDFWADGVTIRRKRKAT